MCLAVPGELLALNTPLLEEGESAEDALLRRTGQVSFGGIVKQVSLAYVPEAIPGDYVIVHVGFALSIVDPEEAQQTLDYLAQLQPVSVD